MLIALVLSVYRYIDIHHKPCTKEWQIMNCYQLWCTRRSEESKAVWKYSNNHRSAVMHNSLANAQCRYQNKTILAQVFHSRYLYPHSSSAYRSWYEKTDMWSLSELPTLCQWSEDCTRLWSHLELYMPCLWKDLAQPSQLCVVWLLLCETSWLWVLFVHLRAQENSHKDGYWLSCHSTVCATQQCRISNSSRVIVIYQEGNITGTYSTEDWGRLWSSSEIFKAMSFSWAIRA